MDVVSQGKMGDMDQKESEKDAKMNQEQQKFSKINDMEQKCYQSIKIHQGSAEQERGHRKEFEKKINMLRQQNNPAQIQDDLFKRVLEKSIE